MSRLADVVLGGLMWGCVVFLALGLAAWTFVLGAWLAYLLGVL